jgi:hypothetical protein
MPNPTIVIILLLALAAVIVYAIARWEASHAECEECGEDNDPDDWLANDPPKWDWRLRP